MKRRSFLSRAAAVALSGMLGERIIASEPKVEPEVTRFAEWVPVSSENMKDAGMDSLEAFMDELAQIRRDSRYPHEVIMHPLDWEAMGMDPVDA